MNNEEKNSLKKWSLLYWVGAVFCFFIFPVVLLDAGLESYINTKNEIEEHETYRKLGINLEKILQYGDARHYYHSLLTKLFDISESENNSLAYLEKAIPYLKERNPGVFNFVIWNNENNSIVGSLSDEKGHKYVLNALNEVIRTLTEENNRNYPVNTSLNEILTKKYNVIRQYVGNYVTLEAFLEPLLKSNLGKIIPATANREKAYIWFKSGRKNTAFVTINKEAIESFDYIEKLINGANKSSKDGIKFGMIDLLHDKSIIPEEKDIKKAEINLALAKYEDYSNMKMTTNNFLILIKVFNPFSRAFCYIPKSLVYTNQNLKNNSVTMVCLIIIAFFLGLWVLYKFTDYNFSMRWKLSLLFLYANGLPLMALGFIGYDYLEQNRNIQLEEAYENISQFINDFDSKFVLIKRDYSFKLNSIIDSVNNEISKNSDYKVDFKKILDSIEPITVNDYNVVDENGIAVFSKNRNVNNNFIRGLGYNFLAYVNNATYTPLTSFHTVVRRKEKDNYTNYSNDGVILDTVVSKVGKIISEQVIDNANYYYINFIGNKDIRKFDYMFALSWMTPQLQEDYIKRNIEKLNVNTRKITCLAFSEQYGKIFPQKHSSETELLSKFRQILNLTSLNFEKITYNGKDYVGYGCVGKELDNFAIIGLFPLDIINEKINNNKLRLIIFIFVSLILTLGVSWFLSIHFLSPIKDLDYGIEAMGRQQFTYRLPVKSADEFGALNQVFNSALESLEDLSVATTVQENLFPLKPLAQNRALVWGKSVTMTRLGGDYFDFFSLTDNEIGVLMGDVAGHGVPAGFLMAMAKASVLLSESDKKDPSKLLAAIHKVFYHVKSKKIKRMMTCVYFCINTETGAFTMANAGHCYPAFIDSNRNVTLLEIDGTPLGITKRARYVNTEGKLEENSYLLLYTDGMLEAHNEAGESIGIKRFKELVSNSYSEDSETFYNNIFAGYKKWSPLADDDITMVLVKFGFDGKEIKKSSESDEETK
jgi:serine phosphatase RsbU (regulator of sigma subunit)